MLKDYIDQYIWAKQQGDEKEMRRIERDLEKLGMDKATLLMLIQEEEQSWIER